MNNLDKKDKELRKQNHLLAYDLLKSFAGWLDNPENEVFSLLEFDQDSLSVAANANVLAAAILRKAAMDIQLTSGIEDTNKYEFDISDALENLVSMANEFDNSNDPTLVKKASLIDEILLTLSSSIDEQEKFKKAMDDKIEDIKKRSKKVNNNKQAQKKSKDTYNIDDVKDNTYRPLQAPLSTRSFPGSPGTAWTRMGDYVVNVETGEQINPEEGYMLNGKKVPGTSVENQTAYLEDVKIPTQFK